MSLCFVGIDPGLVTTGFVAMTLTEPTHEIRVQYYAIEAGPNGEKNGEGHELVADQLIEQIGVRRTRVFIESYRERGTSFSTNTAMRFMLAAFRRQLPNSKVIDNTGVKKVVRPKVLALLGLLHFPTTHHQDLQAAGRILLYGMLKDEQMNALLYRIVTDFVHGTPWTVTTERIEPA